MMASKSSSVKRIYFPKRLKGIAFFLVRSYSHEGERLSLAAASCTVCKRFGALEPLTELAVLCCSIVADGSDSDMNH
ncbi:MAG: hypothetical protein ABSF25_26885, partial [Bryobacteraceae bacterium]